jgi:predicted DNA-binding WGR domain protein
MPRSDWRLSLQTGEFSIGTSGEYSSGTHKQNMQRFYRLSLQPDLFGGCSLIREWGRLGSGGRVRRDGFESEGQAVSALVALSAAKTRRGYMRAG